MSIYLVWITLPLALGSLLLVRNHRVLKFRIALINHIAATNKRDGFQANGSWRWDQFEKVSYDTMLWRFWRPLRSFFPNLDDFAPGFLPQKEPRTARDHRSVNRPFTKSVLRALLGIARLHCATLRMYVRFLDRFSRKVLPMSVLSDKIAEVKSSTLSMIQRVQEDVADQDAKIAELQAKVDQGVATPEEIAALDEVKQLLDALDPKKPTTLP